MDYTPVKELELYFIRHGQSFGNALLVADDASVKEKNDPLLTPGGINEAEKLGDFYSEVPFDAIYTSALRRAVSTAGRLSEKLVRPAPVFVLPGLNEVRVDPEYPGESLGELEAFCPGLRLADGFDERSPLLTYDDDVITSDIYRRAGEVIGYFRNKYTKGEKIAVISHACFMTYLIFYVTGRRISNPVFDVSFDNTGVSKIIFYRPGTNPFGNMAFEYCNSTAHLGKKPE